VGQIRASAPIARAEEAVTPAKAEEATPSETKAFESKPLELIAVTHIENEEFVQMFEAFEQVSRRPDFPIQSF